MKKLIIVMLSLMLLVGCSSTKKDAGIPYNGNNSPSKNYEVGIDGSNDISNGTNSQFSSEEKLVYKSSISLETTNYKEFMDELNALFKKHQTVMQSIREQNEDRRYTDMVVRVPSKNLDSFLQDLKKGSGSIRDISTTVDNITKQYNDNDIRIKALETQHARLLELLKNAGSLTDIIALEQRISEVEIELTKLQSYKSTMDADVEYSTVTISIVEVKTYSETSFLTRIQNAFSRSFSNFVRNVENFIIDVIYALPALIILAAVVFVFRKAIGRTAKALKTRVANKIMPKTEQSAESSE